MQPVEGRKRARDEDGDDSPEKKVRNSEEEEEEEEATETAMNVDGEETAKIAKEIRATKDKLAALYGEVLELHSDLPLEGYSLLRQQKLRFRLLELTGEEGVMDYETIFGLVFMPMPTIEDIQEAAQTVISRWWRRQVRYENLSHHILERFDATNIDPNTVLAISFDELAARLRDKHVLKVMSETVQRVFYLTFGRRGTRRIAEANLNIRVFLAAYMIAFRPTFVFESQSGALEKALRAESERLIASFHRICEELQQKSIRGLAMEHTAFPTQLHSYVKAFKAWKIPDENKLSERIKHALAALYQAESQLGQDEPQESRLRLEFRSQQERLRYKLMQVAGVRVLTDFDALRGRAHLPLPNGAAAASSTAGGAAVSSGNSNNMYSSLPGRMTNEQLAHELLLDPYFKLDDKGGSAVENPVFSRIRESFHVAFWDSLVDDLKLSPPCYVRVVRVLSEVKDGMVDLAGETREADEINRIIDVDAIREQVDTGKLEWVGCVQLVEGIVAVLQRMQAPKRDAETAAQWSSMQEALAQAGGAEQERPAAFCKALEIVLDRVNIIRVDAANARLRMIAPVVRLHGVEYERAHMEKRLKERLKEATTQGNTYTVLELTQQWLAEAVRAYAGDCRVRLASLVAGNAHAFEAVHAQAVLRLLTKNEAPNAEQCPDTLLLDLHRLQAAHAEFHFGVLGATLLVQLQQNKGVREALGNELALIKEFFSSHTPRDTCVGVIEAQLAKHLQDATPPVAPGIVDVVAHTLARSKDAENTVRGVFGGNSGRMAQLWAAAIGKDGLPQSPPLPPVALCFVPRIKRHSATIKNVASLNLKVHVIYYNKIIADCARALQQERIQQEDAQAAAMQQFAVPVGPG